MTQPIKLAQGNVLRHHSGRVYTVMFITNTNSNKPEFPVSVTMIGANGHVWSRPYAEFTPERFKVMFDGTNLWALPT
jgi:hypothetical protein